MSFPVEPSGEAAAERGLFLVQDAEVQARVLPLFSFNPERAEERPVGHGTAFRVDPWSRCLTAYHVVEDLLEVDSSGTGPRLRGDKRLVALEVGGLAYGRVPLPSGAWRPLAGSYAMAGIETPFMTAPRLRNVTELVVIRIRPAQPRADGTPYYPLDLRRWRPRLGERLLALGYADLDRGPGPDDRPIAQRLYGSVGEITDIEAADGARARPWPVVRVAAEWPGGMSGGPVFNERGHVVGVVSSGIGGLGVGTAAIFSGWDFPERIMGSIDPSNPGRFFCHGVFDQDGELVHATQDAEQARGYADEHGLTDHAMVSIDPFDDGWMRIDRRW